MKTRLNENNDDELEILISDLDKNSYLNNSNEDEESFGTNSKQLSSTSNESDSTTSFRKGLLWCVVFGAARGFIYSS